MNTRILGVRYGTLPRLDVVRALRAQLHGARSGLSHVVTVNPEFIMEAQANRRFARVLERADLVTVDGVGVQYAARLRRLPVPPRITGNDLIEIIGELSEREDVRLYLLGGVPGVSHRATEALRHRYPTLTIVGAESGYRGFGVRLPDGKIVDHIRRARPNVLLVAFGSPKQELWIDQYRAQLTSVRIAIGVGGTFDYLAGRVRRAPAAFRRTGFEWLWRLVVQPWRWQRIVNATLRFLFAVVRER